MLEELFVGKILGIPVMDAALAALIGQSLARGA
jgi:hypothetical protein